MSWNDIKCCMGSKPVWSDNLCFYDCMQIYLHIRACIPLYVCIYICMWLTLQGIKALELKLSSFCQLPLTSIVRKKPKQPTPSNGKVRYLYLSFYCCQCKSCCAAEVYLLKAVINRTRLRTYTGRLKVDLQHSDARSLPFHAFGEFKRNLKAHSFFIMSSITWNEQESRKHLSSS